MGRTKGSSSRNPQVQEESQQIEEENLCKTYKSKFLILNHEEGDRFTKIKFSEI